MISHHASMLLPSLPSWCAVLQADLQREPKPCPVLHGDYLHEEHSCITALLGLFVLNSTPSCVCAYLQERCPAQVSALANAAGVGGGAFFVPLFQVSSAVALHSTESSSVCALFEVILRSTVALSFLQTSGVEQQSTSEICAPAVMQSEQYVKNKLCEEGFGGSRRGVWSHRAGRSGEPVAGTCVHPGMLQGRLLMTCLPGQPARGMALCLHMAVLPPSRFP